VARAKRASVRDLVVREGLETMAREAAKRLRELVSSGQEIPYDVRESGNGSALAHYAPLTARFVREHVGALRECDSFGSACAAVESAGLARPYLREAGVQVPPDPRRRAELAGVLFLCRLWHDSTDFSLERERLAAAIDEVEAHADTNLDEVEVVVPLRGFQMPTQRLELATATVVRADTVDVPPEARAPEGLGAAAWEPIFLAAIRVDVGEPGEDEDAPDAGARAVECFRQLITALRLFKAGGVGIGPHAWTKSGGDRWRRVATGAGRVRPGGYRLAEEELGELVAFSRALASRLGQGQADGRGVPLGLARAVSRFEAGLERHAVLEALNDYLLALRFLLDEGGPAQLGLSMRVAALCAEPDHRDGLKTLIDRAIALERELWSGEPAPSDDDRTPADVAAEVEDLARAILKDAACGHLGSDLRATADEILLADGFAVGDGTDEQRGATAEWDEAPDGEEPAPTPEEPEIWLEAIDDAPLPSVEELAPAADELAPDEPPLFAQDSPPADRRVHEMSDRYDEEMEAMGIERAADPAQRVRRPALEAVPADSPLATLLRERNEQREKVASRLSGVFARPDTCEWSVRELDYDRRRRAGVQSS
jgi:hypothetical protein